MGGDEWMDETVPSPRIGSESGDAVGDAPSSGGTPSIYVWLLGFVVLLLALASCGLWALYLRRGQIAGRGPTPTAIIWTPTPVTPSPTSPSPPPTETVAPAPEIAVGRYVRSRALAELASTSARDRARSTSAWTSRLKGRCTSSAQARPWPVTLSGGSSWIQRMRPANGGPSRIFLNL